MVIRSTVHRVVSQDLLRFTKDRPMRWRKFVQITARPMLVIVLAACSGKPTGITQRAATQTGDGETVTVQLSSFAFEPEQIRLKAGVPIRLRLDNASDGGHNFSA